MLSPLTNGPVDVPDLSTAALHTDTKEALEACRRLADWCRMQGFLALLVPCAPKPEETNLVVYPENRPQQLTIEKTDVRVSLNYGPEALVDVDGVPTRDAP